MSDLQKYVHARKQKDKEFALNYDQGYEEFKLCELNLKPSNNLLGPFINFCLMLITKRFCKHSK